MIWVTAILEDIDTRAILPRYEDSCMVHTSKGYWKQNFSQSIHTLLISKKCTVLIIDTRMVLKKTDITLTPSEQGNCLLNNNKDPSMNGEKRLLNTHELVKVWEIISWSSRAQENYRSFLRNLWNILKINERKLKDHNMQPVGLGNTSILTNHVQKILGTQRPIIMSMEIFWAQFGQKS